jgi:hypothetical protein
MLRLVKVVVYVFLLGFLLLSASFVLVSCGATKPGSASEVKDVLENSGFTIQQGKLGPVDIFKMVQAGELANANYQNAGASYFSPMLPPAPGQTAPCYFTDAGIQPADQGLFFDYRLQPDEAVILFGKTPPKCKYFGYDANIATRFSPKTGKPVTLLGNYGDAINPLTIKTDGPADDPYGRNTMIIMTADKGVDASIKAAVAKAGYSSDIINDYPIPSQVLRLGLDQGSDTLTLLNRFAYPVDEQAGKDYTSNPTMSVLRVIPKTSPKQDLFSMPESRVRGTGDFKEQELTHTVEQLRQAILNKYQGYNVQEAVTSAWSGGADGADGLSAIQEMKPAFGPGRDALYLSTTDFTLANDPNEFVIVYGVNHASTDKATYSSLSVYGEQQLNGVASAWSGQWEGTAQQYLPGNPDAKYLYVWKIARNSNGDAHTTGVPYNQGIYGIDLDQPMFLGFRSYVEPETKTGPIATEVYFDRAIKFSKSQ